MSYIPYRDAEWVRHTPQGHAISNLDSAVGTLEREVALLKEVEANKRLDMLEMEISKLKRLIKVLTDHYTRFDEKFDFHLGEPHDT